MRMVCFLLFSYYIEKPDPAQRIGFTLNSLLCRRTVCCPYRFHLQYRWLNRSCRLFLCCRKANQPYRLFPCCRKSNQSYCPVQCCQKQDRMPCCFRTGNPDVSAIPAVFFEIGWIRLEIICSACSCGSA